MLIPLVFMNCRSSNNLVLASPRNPSTFQDAIFSRQMGIQYFLGLPKLWPRFWNMFSLD